MHFTSACTYIINGTKFHLRKSFNLDNSKLKKYKRHIEQLKYKMHKQKRL